MAKKIYESVTSALADLNARRLVTYPSRKIHAIVVALCFDEERKKSEVLDEALKAYVDKIPENKKTLLLKIYKDMTTPQKQHPHRFSKNSY